MGGVGARVGRGDVFDALLDPTMGREQAGRRPVLVLSVDTFNQGRAGLVIVVPITARLRGIASHVEIAPPEGGVTKPSVVMCEQIRSVAVERLRRRHGTVTSATLQQVADRLQSLLDI